MTDKINNDDIIQDPGPLFVPRIELLYEGVEHIYKSDDVLYREVREWVNEKQPHVLWQPNQTKLSYFLYFDSRELYIEFCRKFPMFLKGTDQT